MHTIDHRPSPLPSFPTTISSRPAGKLADAELHLRWGSALRPEAHRVRRVGATRRRGRIVTFPARQYSVNGERRSFALC